MSNFLSVCVMKAFSVMITGRSGQLLVSRMATEEPLEKANSGLPRVGYYMSHAN